MVHLNYQTVLFSIYQLISEVESRTQGSRPRPRTQKKSEAKAKDSLPRTDALEAKDRNARGQGPRTQAQVLSKKKKKKKKVFTKIFQAIPPQKKKKKKKVFTKIFQAISTKKRFPNNFSSAPQNFNIPKNSAVLEPRTGQFLRTSSRTPPLVNILVILWFC